MSTDTEETAAPTTGSYDLLRRRLRDQVGELAAAARTVDAVRVESFGSVALALTAADRLATDLACTPRDVARIGDVLVFGYNTSVELAAIAPEHVFSLYQLSNADGAPTLTPLPAADPLNFLTDETFRTDFDKLYRYYGKARFTDLRTSHGQLLAVFQVGDRLEDIVVLRWSVTQDGHASYIDSRGDRDYSWPKPHDIEWRTCSREDQRAGAHPTVDVLDEVFVGFRAGRLQLRVDDGNGGSHAEIDEPVANPNQSLADVTVRYATAGDILVITVALYNEPERSYVFSRRTRTGIRADAAGRTSRTLPGGDGIVFPGGYHMTATGTRLFDVDVEELILEEIVASANGEDALYVFHRRTTGENLLMPYNLVRRTIDQVITCHGFTIFEDGHMVLFRGAPQDAEAARTHPIQWWATPYSSQSAEAAKQSDGWAARVGNAALVAGLGAIYDIEKISSSDQPTLRTWETLSASVRRSLDTNLWLGDTEASGLRGHLEAIASTVSQLLDEFALRERRRTEARAHLIDVTQQVRNTVAKISSANTPAAVVAMLGELRRTRGLLSAASEFELIDVAAVDALISDVAAANTAMAAHAVGVLDDATAFATFAEQIGTIDIAIANAASAAELDALAVSLTAASEDLDAVVDTVAALEGADPTVRTRIVRAVAAVTGDINRVRATLDSRRRTLSETESTEAFDAEMALVEQTLNGSVANTKTPQECDDVLARLLITIERLESRYGDDPARVAGIAELRSDAHEAVASRRNALIDERNARASRIVEASDRLLATVTRRASEFADDHEIAAFFATDQLTSRVRELADDLDKLGDSGRASEIRNNLRGAAEQAQRRIRDKAAMNDDSGAVVLGGHRLAPNSEPFEIVLSGKDERVFATVTATDFSQDVTEQLAEFSDLLGRPYPSETAAVSRSEYLAWAVIVDAEESGTLNDLLADSALRTALLERCSAVAEKRHADGFQRGVHDADAAQILTHVLPQMAGSPLLRHTGTARAAARIWWASNDATGRETWVARARFAAAARATLNAAEPAERLIEEIEAELHTMFAEAATLSAASLASAASYITSELATGEELALTTTASGLLEAMRTHLGQHAYDDLVAGIAAVAAESERFVTARDCVASFAKTSPAGRVSLLDVDECAGVLATEAAPLAVQNRTVPFSSAVVVSQLIADHPRFVEGKLETRLDALAATAGEMYAEMAVRWPAYQRARRDVVALAQESLRLDEHRPKVMPGFVRNKLIDTALLPLFGANLARQLGTIDGNDQSRQGLLVVVSPPGYGKTTLMEWLADRLGLLVVKVNGPALGADTMSLDPADAPNATARAEVEKINLAFRLGRNVMLYLDDIQHTSPTLLSRFIPLADSTRRIEGVLDGNAHTFDLRGKRFCVVMAGNPYTTGGGRFEMPDMLVNRSDVFNLGDVSGTFDEAFALSYLENSVTACPTLAPHASRLIDDLGPLTQMALGTKPVDASGLSHRWDAADVDSAVRTLALLARARDVLLSVNAAYIASASQTDIGRTAPPFLLQGSYRNMARIASRVVPVMSPAELDALVDDHYAAEAQTLTDRAEQNAVAYQVLTGRADAGQLQRWDEIVASWAAHTSPPDASVQVASALDRLTHVVATAFVDTDMMPTPLTAVSPPPA